MKWAFRLGQLAFVGFIGFAAYSFYDFYRGGFFSLPDLPRGAYPVSFKSGFRGIVYDAEVTDDHYAESPKYFRRLSLANPDRRYLGIPMDVPSWFEDVWSTCKQPTQDMVAYIDKTMPEDMKVTLLGSRLEAVCFIAPPGETPIMRGVLYSAPRM